jgi:protein subunit release factor A
MAENDAVENTQAQDVVTDEETTTPQTFTQEQVDALIKEAETKGFVKGKTDTNSKWEKKAAERERLAKEEAEKQARFEKMSELEKQTTLAKDFEQKYNDLQDKITLTEQREETRNYLKEIGLSDVFLDSVLIPKDAEATKEKAVAIKALFDAEVEKAVQAKIPTHVPKQNGEVENGFDMNDFRVKYGIPLK